MIEEHAQVVLVEGQDVWVETQRQSACGQCSVNKGCGTAVIGKVVGNKSTRVPVLNPDNVSVATGDRVLIGIEEQALVKGSMAIYLMPLLFMFLFGLLGEGLAKQFLLSNPDVLVVILSLLGLAMGFLWVRVFARGIALDSRYQPVLLRRLSLDPQVNLSDIPTS
jgi:sigma-E factor negative regulatory protein RseC